MELKFKIECKMQVRWKRVKVFRPIANIKLIMVGWGSDRRWLVNEQLTYYNSTINVCWDLNVEK